MTSISSQNRKRFNAVLAQALKKQWIYFLIIAVVTVLALIISNVEQMFDSYSKYDVTGNMSIAMMIAAAACTLFSFFTAPRLFKETFKKQQCDIYFSLPIKRSEYFTANYASGLITNFSVYLACILSVVIQSAIYTNKEKADIQFMVLWCIETLLCIVLIYTTFILCAAVSGKRVHYILVTLLLMVSTTYAVNGVCAKLSTIWGFPAYNPNGIFNFFSSLLYLEWYMYNSSVPRIIFMLLIIAAVFALALFCFKKRRAEVAQTSLSGRAFPMLLLAVFIVSAFFYGDSWGKNYIGIIFGFILCGICGLIYSAVFFKRPYTKQSAIVTSCMAVVCAVISIIPIMPSQFRGFEKFVPEAGEVESVSMGMDNIYIDDYYLYSDSASEYGNLKFTSEDAIQKVVAYNNAICEDNVIELSKTQSNISLLRTTLFDGYLDAVFPTTERDGISLTYKLKNGKTIRKFYSVAEGAKSKELAAVMTTDDAFDSIAFLNLRQEDILQSEIRKYKLSDHAGSTDDTDDTDDDFYNEDYEAVKTHKQITDFSEFKNAYRKDIEKYSYINQIKTMLSMFGSGGYYGGYDSAYDLGYSGFTDYGDYADNTYNYQIDIYYYDKNITDEDKKAIEKMTGPSRKTLLDNADCDERVSSSQSSIIAEIQRLSEFVHHDTFVVKHIDRNLSEYMHSLPEKK